MPTIDIEALPYDVDHLFDHPMVLHTQSSIKTFRTCPQKYVLRYLLQLDTTAVSLPFTVGRAVHAGLAELLRPQIDLKQEDRILKAAQAVDKPFETIFADPVIGGEIDEKLRQGQAQAHALVEMWPLFHAELRENWIVKAAEITIRNEKATLASSLEERQAGRLDALVQRIKEQDMFLVEHKSRSSMGNTNFINNLEMDTQAIWYALLARPYYDLTGFYYDMLVKPQHRMGKAGWEELKSRMIDAIADQPDKYFACPDVLFNQLSIDRYEEMFKRQITIIDELEPRKVYMNDSACSEYSGCQFRSLCEAGADCACPRMVMEMPEVQMYQLKTPHSELDDE